MLAFEDKALPTVSQNATPATDYGTLGLPGNVRGLAGEFRLTLAEYTIDEFAEVLGAPKAGMKPPRIFPVSHCGSTQAGHVMVKLS
jgi:hypothetical protein